MDRFKQLIGIDFRTLAIFRVALGAMVIIDLVTRSVDLRAHYTDFGILPRDFWLSPQAGTLSGWEFSLHLASGTAWFQAVLFVIAGLFAFMLLLGYRTRLASVVSWLLLLSLHHRNLYILQGSDMLLLLMLFWGMFLPLGARWSFDAVLTRESDAAPRLYISVMGVGLLLQVVSVYFFTALLKDSPDWWPDGIAVFYATHYAQYLSPTGEMLGRWMEGYPSLSYLLTYYVWFLELCTPLLLFFPYRNAIFRLVTLSMLFLLHLGFWISMEIGLFPLVSMTSLLIFIPSAMWARVTPILTFPASRRLGNLLCDWITANRPILDWWSSTRLPRRPVKKDEPLLVSVLGIALIALLLVSNIQSLQKWHIKQLELVEPIMQTIRFLQWWNMFAPSPIGMSTWLVVEGELEDGSKVDVLGGFEGEVDWERPENIANWYDNYRWRKYFHTISANGYDWYQWHWGHYLCRKWNEDASVNKQLTGHTIHWMYETLHPGWEGQRSIEKFEGQTVVCAHDPT